MWTVFRQKDVQGSEAGKNLHPQFHAHLHEYLSFGFFFVCISPFPIFLAQEALSCTLEVRDCVRIRGSNLLSVSAFQAWEQWAMLGPS